MVDTIKAIQIVHDTLYIKGAEGLDVLYKTDAFYKSAWENVKYLLVIGGSVIGILVPLIIQYYQSRQLKLNTETLKKEIKDDLLKAQNELKEDIDKKINTELEKINIKVEKNLEKTKGFSHSLQGGANVLRGNLPRGFIDYIIAASAYLKIPDYENLFAVLKAIEALLNKKEISLEEIDNEVNRKGSIFKEIKNTYRPLELFEKISKIDADETLKELCIDVKSLYVLLPKTKEERMKLKS